MARDLEYYLSLPYRVELFYHPEDDTWEATHPELGRGTCYAIGDSQEEALALLEQDRRELIEILLDEGREIPEPAFEEESLPNGRIMLRIPRSLHQSVKDVAKKEGVSINQFIATILARGVGTIDVKQKYDQLFKRLLGDKYLEEAASHLAKYSIVWEYVLSTRTEKEYEFRPHRRKTVQREYETEPFFFHQTAISEPGKSYGK